MLGQISRILTDKGYGFVKSDDGDYFIHPQLMAPDSPLSFDQLKVGQTVSFEPSFKVTKGQKKLRAENITFIG